MRAVFLDRDGVINENRDSYVTGTEQFRFLPGAVQALARLAASPFLAVIVTNQSAVGRGRMNGGMLQVIHAQLLKGVREAGGRIDGIYACLHRPDEGCACRKPRPQLLYRAASELDLDLEASYFIGDAASDVQAALAVRCQPILVQTGRGSVARIELARQQIQDYWLVRDLRHAVELILARENGSAVADPPWSILPRVHIGHQHRMALASPPVSGSTGGVTVAAADFRRAGRVEQPVSSR